LWTDRNLGRALATAGVALFLCSCGSTSTSSITGPSSSKCQVSVGGGSMSFPPQGGNGSVQVSTNRDCSWSAEASAGWIHLGAASGQGEGTIPFTVDPNPGTSPRGGAIEISNAGLVSVTQAAQPPPPPPAAPSPSPGPSPTPTPTPTPVPTPPTPPDDAGEEVELRGAVSLVTGDCPGLTFTLSGRIVQTDENTDFKGLHCRDLKDGRKVKVKGVVRNDGIVLATKIEKD
jgi:hypothetical protein